MINQELYQDMLNATSLTLYIRLVNLLFLPFTKICLDPWLFNTLLSSNLEVQFDPLTDNLDGIISTWLSLVVEVTCCWGHCQ